MGQKITSMNKEHKLQIPVETLEALGIKVNELSTENKTALENGSKTSFTLPKRRMWR